MRKKILFVILCLITDNAKASKLIASSLGFNAIDVTTTIDAAFQSLQDTIVFDLQANDWILQPLNVFDLQNKVIIFEKGVKFRAKAGAYTGIYASMLRMVRCINVKMIGYGAEFLMNKTEYISYNNSEFRHCLQIENASGLSIYGFVFKDSGGDGIYLGGETITGTSLTYSENIIIEDVACINNYRQGISVTSAQNLLVKNCLFTQTIGTLPEAGVDLEPYLTYQRMVNVNFTKCKFSNNNWSGIAVAMPYLDSNSIPISIIFNDCVLENNGSNPHPYGASEIYVGANDSSPVKGVVDFNRCYIKSSNYSAFYSRKTWKAFQLNFNDCVFNNVSQLQLPYNDPIFLEVPSYSNTSQYIGGINWNNVFISYTSNFNFLRVYGWTTLLGIKNIEGHFTIVEPNNSIPLYQLVADTINCNYTYTNQVTLPLTEVSIDSADYYANECNNNDGKIIFGRTSSRIDYPIGVNYDLNSSNINFSDDIHFMTEGIVMSTNVLQCKDTIISRDDKEIEIAESVDLQLLSNSQYLVSANVNTSFTLLDCTNILSIEKVKKQFQIYPSITDNYLYIEDNNIKIKAIRIVNMYGQEVKKINHESENINYYTINVRNLINGIYFIELLNDKKEKSSFKFLKM